MAESKLLEVDKDEWIYQTMNKYSNLYMFELEYQLDTLEIINETSLCVSGVQAYSKKCEILQLCVPPKLLRDENEEGLCKDRDFKILSGGYTDGRVLQTKFIKSSANLVATTQDGYAGVIIYEVGDDNRATILEKLRLATNTLSLANSETLSSLCSMNERIVLGTTSSNNQDGHNRGVHLDEWKIEGDPSTPSQSHLIWNKASDLNYGNMIKLREWDNNSCIFLTSSGTVALCDLRTKLETPGLLFHASKSPIIAHPPESSSNHPIIFTFDCLPKWNKIGVLDSCGGYETFDARNVCTSGPSTATTTRSLLPEFADLAGVYSQWFNIELEEKPEMMRENVRRNRFIISGLKRECVPVFQEELDLVNKSEHCETTSGVSKLRSVFSHDGHSKPVTHAIWHPASNNLVYSASVDAVLHAWQFIPEEEEEKTKD